VICPNCGKTIKDTARFCAGCGAKVEGLASAATQPAENIDDMDKTAAMPTSVEDAPTVAMPAEDDNTVPMPTFSEEETVAALLTPDEEETVAMPVSPEEAETMEMPKSEPYGTAAQPAPVPVQPQAPAQPVTVFVNENIGNAYSNPVKKKSIFPLVIAFIIVLFVAGGAMGFTVYDAINNPQRFMSTDSIKALYSKDNTEDETSEDETEDTNDDEKDDKKDDKSDKGKDKDSKDEDDSDKAVAVTTEVEAE
jgi:hypothetical protein